MRVYTRIVFGLNAIYQLVVGAVFLFAPATAIGLYGFAASESQSVAARVSIRALGTFVLLGGGISGWIARNPDAEPAFLPVMGSLAVLTLLCWGITLANGDMTFGQVGLDIVVQVLLLAAVVGYARKARAAR